MSGEVISFGSRRPVAEEQAAEAAEAEMQARSEDEMEEATVQSQVSSLVQTLKGMADLVEKGAISGVLAIGRDTTAQKFLTEVSVDPRRLTRGEVYEWIGIVETLKLELMDMAQMAPVLMPNGETLDPAQNKVTVMDLEEMFDD